jgi:hypothetical protein
MYPGGYNGAKEGYEIPAGTDIFVSVSLGNCRNGLNRIVQQRWTYGKFWHCRYTTSTDPHIFGTGQMNLNLRGFQFQRRMRA